MKSMNEVVENVKVDNPKWCIFESRICEYANKNGNSFKCKAPSDEEMTCR